MATSTDPLWQSLALGCASGWTCVAVGFPLDSIKVRLQSGAPRAALFANLWRGILPPMLAVVPTWGGVFLA